MQNHAACGAIWENAAANATSQNLSQLAKKLKDAMRQKSAVI